MREEYKRIRSSLDKELPKECGNCGSTEELDIHHIVPISLGGTNRITNLVRLCTSCHAKAHGGLPVVEASRKARVNRAKLGKTVAGKAPIGYKYINDEFKINEEEANVVRFIYRMRFKYGYSTLNIAKILNHMAIPTKGGAKKWTHPTIRRIIDNHKYFGYNFYNGVNYGKNIPPILDDSVAEHKRRFEKRYEGTRVPARSVRLG